MTLPIHAKELLISFNSAHSWEQKMRLLMQTGSTLEIMPEEEKKELNQIKGCESQVWLTTSLKNNLYYFKAFSDARIVRGLLAILLVRINGLTMDEIKTVDLEDWFIQLGLSRQLSSSRREGLSAIFLKIKTIC